MSRSQIELERLPELMPSRCDGVTLFIAAAVLASVATMWALVIKPLPFSDWEYYWKAAQGTISYERGGVLLFALGQLQTLSMPPYVTALTMNLVAAFTILMLTYKADGARFGVAALLVWLYLLAITPYYSVVQFDLPATALLCGGLHLVALNAVSHNRAWYLFFAVVLISFAVSSRPQFFLVLMVFGSLLALAAIFSTRLWKLWTSKIAIFSMVLVIAAVLGFAIDSTLRASAGRSDAVRTNSAVTLYAGLLSSDTSRPACGHWSIQATREARADAELPLIQAVLGRLEDQPLSHWATVVRCKIPGIVFPSSYALSWSLGAPGVTERNDASDNSQLESAWVPMLYRLERIVYSGVLIGIYAFSVLITARRAKKQQWVAAILPTLWVISYWLVHSIFEIQARYFLGLFLVLLFIIAAGNANMLDRGLRARAEQA